ncbi:PREDICTED: uncharacterized protein LOC104588472 [Nelumbo nucifera]|uniref:Uncharacterized protein LOC104588472 n=1 Tax=Nelumbo nucifera TaxID=4432 RepID=A0A1U7Z254_NELNU|nr:PREDICTED: uncharacterized protein LOC104588472 [Nelumbo nucifera]
MGFQPQPPPQEKKSNLEEMISKFINTAEAKFQSHETSIKNLKVQVGQIISTLSERKEGRLPNNTEKNPREHVNAIALRSGKTVGEAQEDDKEAELADLQKENERSTPKLNLDEIKLPIPYTRRVFRDKLDKQFEKFLEVFKKIHINLPLLDVLSQMPKYAKFLKEVMSNKRKWEDCEMELTSTTITLQLANRSIKYPRGIVEDVLVKVGNFIIPTDFIMLDMEEDRSMPLILGRPFLATGNALIDVQKGQLTLRINGEEVIFNVFQTLKYPNTREHEIYAINSIDVVAAGIN